MKKRRLHARKSFGASKNFVQRSQFHEKIEIDNINRLLDLVQTIARDLGKLEPKKNKWSAVQFRRLRKIIQQCEQFKDKAEMLKMPAWESRVDSILNSLHYIDEFKKTPSVHHFQDLKAMFQALKNDVEHMYIWKHEELSKPALKIRRSVIFILEDNELYGDMMVVQLENQGFDAECFDTMHALDQAMELVKPDLLLVDLNLAEGKMAGIEYLQKLNGSVPAIVLSARFDMTARVEAMRAGAVGYLTKPVASETLKNVICQNLEVDFMKKPKAVVIDDDALTADTYSKFLEQYDIETRAITDVSKVLDELSQVKPDVIFMDIKMPVASGYEVANIIYQVFGEMNAPEIIYMTGSLQEDKALYDPEDLRDGGVLLKPLKPLQMANIVEEKMEQKKALHSAVQ